MQCSYRNHKGLQCIRVPRGDDVSADAAASATASCCVHKGRHGYVPCRLFDSCGCWTRSLAGYCTRCQIQNQAALRREKKLQVAASPPAESAPAPIPEETASAAVTVSAVIASDIPRVRFGELESLSDEFQSISRFLDDISKLLKNIALAKDSPATPEETSA